MENYEIAEEEPMSLRDTIEKLKVERDITEDDENTQKDIDVPCCWSNFNSYWAISRIICGKKWGKGLSPV